MFASSMLHIIDKDGIIEDGLLPDQYADIYESLISCIEGKWSNVSKYIPACMLNDPLNIIMGVYPTFNNKQALNVDIFTTPYYKISVNEYCANEKYLDGICQNDMISFNESNVNLYMHYRNDVTHCQLIDFDDLLACALSSTIKQVLDKCMFTYEQCLYMGGKFYITTAALKSYSDKLAVLTSTNTELTYKICKRAISRGYNINDYDVNVTHNDFNPFESIPNIELPVYQYNIYGLPHHQYLKTWEDGVKHEYFGRYGLFTAAEKIIIDKLPDLIDAHFLYKYGKEWRYLSRRGHPVTIKHFMNANKLSFSANNIIESNFAQVILKYIKCVISPDMMLVKSHKIPDNETYVDGLIIKFRIRKYKKSWQLVLYNIMSI